MDKIIEQLNKIQEEESNINNKDIASIDFNGSQIHVKLTNGEVISSNELQIPESEFLSRSDIEKLIKSFVEEKKSVIKTTILGNKKNVSLSDILKLVEFIESEINFLSKKIVQEVNKLDKKIKDQTSTEYIRNKIEESFTNEKLDKKFIEGFKEDKSKGKIGNAGVNRLSKLIDVNLDGLDKDESGRYILGGSQFFSATNYDFNEIDYDYVGKDGKINRYTKEQPITRTQAIGDWADRETLTYT